MFYSHQLLAPKAPLGQIWTRFVITLCAFAILASSDLASDRASLVAFRSAVGGLTVRWNMTKPRPCSWQGVVCTNGRVTALHLPRMGLSGKLPAGLGNLTKLQTLSLRFNALTGPIPVDLGNLAHLDTLTLEHNGFTGSVPDFSAPPLTHFNVSYNHLNGSIPKRFWRLDKSAFEGNSLCGVPLQPCPGSNNGSKDKTRKSGKLSKLILILGIVIVSLFGALILLLLFCLGRKTRQSGDSSNAEASEHVEAIGDGGSAVSDSASASPRMENILVFFGNTEIGSTLSFDELMDGNADTLGIGTFGTTYRMMGRSLVMKVLESVKVTKRQFRKKMEELGNLDHHNLLPLRGYCFKGDTKMVLYDDQSAMGSLYALLHEEGRVPVNWERRCFIALGAAEGVAYLHSLGPTSCHGNIKSTNILLTVEYQSLLSEFGLSHLALPIALPKHVSSYCAPEAFVGNKMSQKADVYSFGIILLELLTRKIPASSTREGINLLYWVQVQSKRNTQFFDMQLLQEQNVADDMLKFLHLAFECTAEDPDMRPPMEMVAKRIEELYLKRLV